VPCASDLDALSKVSLYDALGWECVV